MALSKECGRRRNNFHHFDLQNCPALLIELLSTKSFVNQFFNSREAIIYLFIKVGRPEDKVGAFGSSVASPVLVHTVYFTLHHASPLLCISELNCDWPTARIDLKVYTSGKKNQNCEIGNWKGLRGPALRVSIIAIDSENGLRRIDPQKLCAWNLRVYLHRCKWKLKY